MRNSTCKILSDASYDPQTGKCGYGVVIAMNNLCIFKYGSIHGVQSPAEAEVLAAKKGLDYLETKGFKNLGRPVRKVVLLSDNHCVDAFNEGCKMFKHWNRSPKKTKQRLANIIRKMRETASKYDRGFRAIHITGHKNLEGSMDPENRQLEYKYNSWCDNSARMSRLYGLRGKKIVKCRGFPDPSFHEVVIPMKMLTDRLDIVQNSFTQVLTSHNTQVTL